jgi:hypothetical protein
MLLSLEIDIQAAHIIALPAINLIFNTSQKLFNPVAM